LLRFVLLHDHGRSGDTCEARVRDLHPFADILSVRQNDHLADTRFGRAQLPIRALRNDDPAVVGAVDIIDADLRTAGIVLLINVALERGKVQFADAVRAGVHQLQGRVRVIIG